MVKVAQVSWKSWKTPLQVVPLSWQWITSATDLVDLLAKLPLRTLAPMLNHHFVKI